MTEFPKTITATRSINAWPENREWWTGIREFNGNPTTIDRRNIKCEHYVRLDIFDRVMATLHAIAARDEALTEAQRDLIRQMLAGYEEWT